MSLHLLPTRTAGAAENMAVDFLLLQRYPDAGAPRFRHYDWRAPARTFGYSQKIAWVRAALGGQPAGELCRRPTGGGIVDHRHDWTYALVLPPTHPLHDVPAPESYRVVHECLATALTALGQPAAVNPAAPTDAGGPGVCFHRAERFDVIRPGTGAKLAGAAQKRNRHGLLFQGSIDRLAVGALDWEAFGDRFPAELAGVLGTAAETVPWPDLAEDEVAALTEHYASPEWVEVR